MKYRIMTLCIVLCFAAACTSNNAVSTKQPQQTTKPESLEVVNSDDSQQATEFESLKPELEEIMANFIQATITMEDGGTIGLELYPELAPQSVRNFVYLARQGFYDGLTFHRIIKGFMIQGGDPEGTGIGGPGYSIKGEFESNGFKNDLKHDRGVISMARSQSYDSAGSQFFILHADYHSLDGDYAAFGRVITGMDVVDRLADTPNSGPNGAVAEKDKPVIKSITVEDDSELPMPDMLKAR